MKGKEMNIQHARPTFSVFAYGNNQTCRLEGDMGHDAELISIGANAARIRLCEQADNILRLGERCLLSLDISLGDQPSGPTPCSVAWMDGREAGLAFSSSFTISIVALQHRIAPSSQAQKEAE